MQDSTARPRLDDQQRLAVETLDRSVAVVAGAGTGKTTVLVERFIALLDANPDWPITAVVAITFTESAAEEMRSRVRQRILQRISTAKGEDRRRWAEHLSRIEATRISTIHGLCSEVIRANAAAVGVDPGFQVADEASAAVLMKDALAIALRDFAGADPETGDPNAAAAQEVLTRYDRTDVEEVLLSAKQYAGLEPPPAAVDTIEAMFERAAESRIAEICASDAARDILSIDAPPAADKQGSLVLAAQASLRAAADPDIPTAEKVASLKALKFHKSYGSVKNWANEQQFQFAKDSMASLKTEIKALEDLAFDRDLEETALVLTHGWHTLIHHVLAVYEELKRRNDTLDFDDLEVKAEILLMRPDVRRRYAGREIQHVMVDEFQDTNHRQWNIAQGLAPDLMDGGVFIVGDPKQSIYAFRGADVTIFKAASEQIQRAGGLIVHMNRSYRTHSALVGQLNRLFDGVMKPLPGTTRPEQFVTFDETHALTAQRESPDDHLDVQFFSVAPDGTKPKSIITEAQVIAAHIRDIVTRKSLTVIDRTTQQPRPASYGDFAVLLRSFRGNSGYFEQAFVEFGVPYVTQSGRGFYDRREIRDLIELLKALRNPSDDLALAAALHSPLFALSDVDLITLRSRGGTLYEALDEEAALQAEHESLEHPIVFAHTIFDGLCAVSGHLPADTLLLRIIAETNYLASIGRLPGGRQMRANVEKLVDIAREQRTAALPDFIAFLEVSREAEVKEAGVALDSGASVRLTTIHGSKGLEFPVVWLASVSLKSHPNNRAKVIAAESIACRMPQLAEDGSTNGSKLKSFWFTWTQQRKQDAAAAEAQRLFYVAATRARDALFISASGKDSNSLNALSEALDGAAIQTPSPPQTPHKPLEARVRVEDTGFPLAETSPAAPPPSRRRLTATDIADYGSLENADSDTERDYYHHRIARRLHADDYEPIETLTYDTENSMPSQRRIGSLVHSALLYRVDILMKDDPERAYQVIDSLVWEAGFTLSEARRMIVERVRSYLEAYAESPVARAIEQAKEVYRELPFVIERDGQLVHGKMDLVFVDHEDRWTIIDFKTDSVSDNAAAITTHARRYMLQLAVYAAALRERVGATPTAQVVYLRYPRHVVTLPPAELDRELARLKLDAIAAHFDSFSPHT